MLKPLIWGSQAPEWEAEDAEDEVGVPGWQRSSQNSTASAVPKQEHQPQPASSSLRGTYDVNRKGLAGPLSVNDPQLLEPPTHRLRFTNSESFFNIASPFGPPGASNTWSLSRRDAPEHVHLLLRALMAAHDYAGAARALATLHRLHSLFDPDVYRYTVALLRLAGDHQKTSMYFRKILGKRLLAGVFAPKGGSVQGSVRGRATAHDFLAYLADRQEFDEALDISQQNLLQGGSFLSHGPFKQDPSLKAHGAVLRLFVALLEHQACRSRHETSDGTSSAADPPAPPAGDAAAATGRRRPPPLIPGLQDPLSLVGRLRACWVDCAAGAAGGSRQARALEHLRDKSTAAATPPPPPRPGTIWDHLYGADPPWAPTDFVAARGRVVGSGLADNGRAGVGGALGGQAMGDGGGGDRGGLSALGSYSPHPLLRGVDAELWEETVLDPDAEPLLLAPGGDGGGRGQDGGIWCSDDEDCCSASDDESALLQERARLASRGTGGCVYFSPPGGEDGVFRRRQKRRGEERGAARTSSRRPFFETMTVAGIVLEGTAETQAAGPEEGDHARDPEVTGREVEDGSGGGRLRQGGGDAAAAAAAAAATATATRQSHVVEKVLVNAAGGEAEGGSSEDDEGVASRATKRRRRQGASAEQGASGGIPGSSGRGRNRSNRRDLESEDDDNEPDDDYEPEAPGVARPSPANLKVERNDGDQDSEEEADEDYMTAPGLREAEAPLGPPTGTDAAATRLSETVSVKLPVEAAAWLLADKCCVAAHMFGPQHRYCLRAIGRLCREDVREAACPARAALRSQGFRLQLSLTRLAADNVRGEAAKEGKASVAWGLPDAPPAAQHVLPFDSYVPEPFGSLAAADDSSN
ncbi:unnamed protein product [Ectocarpus sp. 12 AP-2014]